MADNVKINFEVNSKELLGTIAELEKLGKADKATAEEFKKANQIYKERELALKNVNEEQKKVGESAQQSGKKISESSKAVKSDLSSLTDTIKNVGAAIGIAFGVQQIIQFGKESVKAFLEAEVNANKLAFAIRNIGKEGESAFQKLIDQSSRLQDQSIFSDDDIQRAQTALVQFGLTTNQVEKLIPKILDLASAQGTDLATATDKIISGINGQTKSLRDAGISFEDTGSKTENLSILTDRLTKFQGSSAEALQTTAGQAENLKNKIGDLGESIGEFLVDSGGGLKRFFEDFAGFISPAFAVANDANRIADQIQKDTIRKRKVLQDELSKLDADGLKKRIQQETDYIDQIAQGKLKSTEADVRFSAQSIEISRQLLKDKKSVEDDLTAKGLSERDALNAKIAEAQKKLNEQILLDEKVLRSKILDLQARTEEEKLRREADKQIESVQQSKANETLKAEAITQIEVKLNQDLEDLNKKRLEKQAEEDKKAAEERSRERLKIQQEESKAAEDALEEELKMLEDFERAKQDARTSLTEEGISAIKELNQIGTDNENKRLDDELNGLNEQLEQKKISQEQFNEESLRIKRQQSKNDKNQALFNIAIDTAEAILKAVAISPQTFGLPFSAFAAATGAIQAGVVAARPLPFAKGTKAVPGGIKGQDSVHALLMPDEMVIPVDKKRKYEPILNAIFDERISPELLNTIALSGKMNFSKQTNQLDEYKISDGMSMALRKGIYVKNMPKQSGISSSEIELMVRRGIISK